MFENRVIRISGHEGKDKRGEWKQNHSWELHYLYSSPNVVRVIKSEMVKWVGYVTRIEENISADTLVCGKPDERQLESIIIG
jgi:hypothetical protein